MLPERVGNWSDYPFNVPTIASLRELEIKKPVVFFVGENGSGKSTLLEAIAIHYGFGGEGGNRNFSSATTESVRGVEPLAKALRVAFSRRTGRGFFLRAESFFNTATAIDALGTAGAWWPQPSRPVARRVIHCISSQQIQSRRIVPDRRTRSGAFRTEAIELACDSSRVGQAPPRSASHHCDPLTDPFGLPRCSDILLRWCGDSRDWIHRNPALSDVQPIPS